MVDDSESCTSRHNSSHLWLESGDGFPLHPLQKVQQENGELAGSTFDIEDCMIALSEPKCLGCKTSLTLFFSWKDERSILTLKKLQCFVAFSTMEEEENMLSKSHTTQTMLPRLTRTAALLHAVLRIRSIRWVLCIFLSNWLCAFALLLQRKRMLVLRTDCTNY